MVMPTIIRFEVLYFDESMPFYTKLNQNNAYGQEKLYETDRSDQIELDNAGIHIIQLESIQFQV